MNTATTTKDEIARHYFQENFNCAQAVLAAFAPELGLSETQALKLASPFGGGVARRGLVCGAVSGALMALGLAGGAATPAEKEAAYRMSQEFLQRFETRHASLLCRDLLGYDLATPEGNQAARQAGVFNSLCPRFVGDAAQLVQDMLHDG
jgi:C_GCAxxG_C_C family probable redox protein